MSRDPPGCESANKNRPNEKGDGKDKKPAALGAPRQANHQKRQQQIELEFYAKRPRVRKRSPTAQPKVLGEGEKLPERRHLLVIPQRRRQKVVDEQDDEISGKNTQGASLIKPGDAEFFSARGGFEQLAANKIATQDEEKVNPDPTEALHFKRKKESKNTGVIDEDQHNGQSAQEVEPWPPMRTTSRIELSGT